MLRKLRNKKPINYYEAEEPAHDAYEFCEDCNDFVEEFCTSHGGLLVIPDDKVPTGKSRLALPRAMLTVPAAFLYINSSSIPAAGLGVFARVTIPRGARFGPYRGSKRHLSQTNSDYGWQITGVGSHVCDGVDASRSNWMRYVNCARHSLEQNIVAYQYHGRIYYSPFMHGFDPTIGSKVEAPQPTRLFDRTSKIIRAGRELLVFYGREFAAKLNIDLANYNKSPAQLERTMGNTSDKQDTDIRNTQNNLADSLNATSAELRKVNECLGAVDLDKYKPADDREIDFLSMLKMITYMKDDMIT